MNTLRASAPWAALQLHAADLADTTLRELFARDPGRAERQVIEAGDLRIDWSKHRVTEETVALLVEVAHEAGVPERIEAMFRGDPINVTERRAALHVALRAGASERIEVDGADVVPAVQAVLRRAGDFAEQVRSGAFRGHTGARIRTVVNIGIGGSDLGPAMAYDALLPFASRDLRVRHVANVDGADLSDALDGLEPAETLFVVCSKTFTTLETITNARSAREWLLHGPGGLRDDAAVARHFAAVSTNAAAVAEFGIDAANMFEFWDWVGGRYSVDSAIGLSLMIAVGAEGFSEFLAGFRRIDDHLRHAPLGSNAPVMMALLGYWYGDFFGASTQAVVPYSHRLRRFPEYLQQLDMESNGKGVRLDGAPVDGPTGPIVWGTVGTNGQHAYFQLLHQGTHLVPVDLIGIAQPEHGFDGHHELLMANLLAQAEALAFGRTEAEAAARGIGDELLPHRTFSGNRPTTLILTERLDPSTLGQLIALYEHKVLVQGVLFGVNSFDQWGVELGKELAGQLVPELRGGAEPGASHDSSTARAVEWYRRRRGDQPR